MRRVVFLALVAATALLPAANLSAETAADKAMAQQIGLQLKESGRLHNYRIGVKYEDGVAWLNGTVTSPAQRDAAVNTAREVNGVSHVVSRLEVAGEPATGRSNLSGAFEQPEPASSGAAPASAMVRQPMPQNQAPARRPQSMSRNMPVPMGRMQGNPGMPQGGPQGMQAAYESPAADSMPYAGGGGMAPPPSAYVPGGSGGRAVSYDNAQMPGYAWPSYASYPNYAALTYPQQYSPTAWPYIGPFYPYPQVPLAWRRVSLEWDDGWWFLDFSAHNSSH